MKTDSKPVIVSFITCDGVHLDSSSGKYYLLGVFSNISGQQFPLVHSRMFWFLILTDVSVGEHEITISLGMPAESPVINIVRPFKSESPLHRIHLINEIKNLRVPKPGSYTLMVEVDDEPLLVTNFGVSLAK